MINRFFSRLLLRVAARAFRRGAAYGLPDDIVRSAPSPANAVNIFAGEWASILPGKLAELSGGESPVFEDHRVRWLIERMGGIEGMRILEMGPLEGGHSYMLERHGAEDVLSIEANARAFLKCLIVKELLGLSKVRFQYGDAIEYLRAAPDRFDLVVASGVLYHMANPVEVLALLAGVTDRLFIWTHLYDEAVIQRDKRLAMRFSGEESARFGGFDCRVHRHEYFGASHLKRFWGGTQPHSCWMNRKDLLAGLDHFGFDRITVGEEIPNHPKGPCITLLASRGAS